MSALRSMLALVAIVAAVIAAVTANAEDKKAQCQVTALNGTQSPQKEESPVLSAGCNRAAIQVSGELQYEAANVRMPIKPVEVVHFDYVNNDSLAYLILATTCGELNITFAPIPNTNELEMRNISVKEMSRDIFDATTNQKFDALKLDSLQRCRVQSKKTRTTNGSFECHDLSFNCFCSVRGTHLATMKLDKLKLELKRNRKTAPRNAWESTSFGECKHALTRKRRTSEPSGDSAKAHESHRHRYWASNERQPNVKDSSMDLFEVLSRAEHWAP